MPRTFAIRTFLALCCTFVFGAAVSADEVQHSQLLQVAIRSPKVVSYHEDQETVLLGYIRIGKQTASDVRYKWNLPEGVSVVSGHKQGYIRELRAGEISEVRLTVTGFSQDDLKDVSLSGDIVDGEIKAE